MKRNLIILIVVIGLCTVSGVAYFSREKQSTLPPQAEAPLKKTDEQAVRDLVTQFGEKLRMVSLAAPKELLVKQIEDAYAPYVSPNLLSAWTSNPERAPGKFSSSPWPERIEILLVEPSDDGSYEVQGKVIEVTSVEELGGGSASEYQIALKLRKQNDAWVITGFTKMIPQ